MNVNFGGPVLRYGLGYSYDLFQKQCYFQCLDCGELHESVGNRLSFVWPAIYNSSLAAFGLGDRDEEEPKSASAVRVD